MSAVKSAIQYFKPDNWIKYDREEVFQELTDAKAAIISLRTIPYQRRWVEELQKMQLKMEVAGTSKIEGAEFAGNELEIAIKAEAPEDTFTRSQRQANAVTRTYKMIAAVATNRPVDTALMCQIHSSIVTGCDDDKCAPGELRKGDQNVTFGKPTHRGACAGEECRAAFEKLAHELETSFKNHDPLIQALALHYHLAAIHPFGDGNGRTARALEALLLQRAGLKDTLFIAMSNYYHEEREKYLDTLAQVRAGNCNLTPFLKFGLRGITQQCGRLYKAIRDEVSKEIFRNLTRELFVRLESTRKRVIVRRQLSLLDKLLNIEGAVEFSKMVQIFSDVYKTRKNPVNALIRDLNRLSYLGAIRITKEEKTPNNPVYYIAVVLDWPTQITETEFFAKLAHLPKSKTYGFLSAEET